MRPRFATSPCGHQIQVAAVKSRLIADCLPILPGRFVRFVWRKNSSQQRNIMPCRYLAANDGPNCMARSTIAAIQVVDDM